MLSEAERAVGLGDQQGDVLRAAIRAYERPSTTERVWVGHSNMTCLRYSLLPCESMFVPVVGATALTSVGNDGKMQRYKGTMTLNLKGVESGAQTIHYNTRNQVCVMPASRTGQ